MMNLLLILVIQIIVVLFLVEMLVRYMPRALVRESRDNCFRVDGSKSRRRANFEVAARNHLRLDLFAAFLFVALVGNGIATCMQAFVIPIPTALAAINLFQFDQKEWSDALEANRVADNFQNWSSSSSSSSPEFTLSLKRSVALFFTVSLASIFVALLGLKHAYLKALADFHQGVRIRRELHMSYDLARISMEAESYEEAPY